jgi:cytosine/adenosine deaminase-related metal-dependent hydrolase
MTPITNAHTHLELTDLAYLCPPDPVPFAAWMSRLVWHLRRRSKAQIEAAISQGIAELKACGTTHVGDITNTWLSVEPLLTSGLRGIVYLELLGNDKNRTLQRLEEAKREIDKTRRHRNYGMMQVGLSIHAPYSCHPDLLRTGAEWCRLEDVPLCLHVAESPAETELLLTGNISSLRWSLVPLLKLSKILSASVPHLRPIQYLADLGVLDAQPLLVHAVQVTDEDIDLVARTGCAVVHCPRSNERLSCGRMPLERYLATGVPVYLGTDSRASSPDLNVQTEAEFAQQLHAGLVKPQEVMELIHQPFP